MPAADVSRRGSWFDAVRHALRWFHCQTADLAQADWTGDQIMHWAFQAPAHMPKMIRRAVRRHILQEHTAHQVLTAHRDIKAMCVRHGVVFDDLPEPECGVQPTFECSLCCKSFLSIQGLTAHKKKQHQQISEECSFVISSTCMCCRRCFWTAQRLQQHLHYSCRFPDGCF